MSDIFWEKVKKNENLMSFIGKLSNTIHDESFAELRKDPCFNELMAHFVVYFRPLYDGEKEVVVDPSVSITEQSDMLINNFLEACAVDFARHCLMFYKKLWSKSQKNEPHVTVASPQRFFAFLFTKMQQTKRRMCDTEKKIACIIKNALAKGYDIVREAISTTIYDSYVEKNIPRCTTTVTCVAWLIQTIYKRFFGIFSSTNITQNTICENIIEKSRWCDYEPLWTAFTILKLPTTIKRANTLIGHWNEIVLHDVDIYHTITLQLIFSLADQLPAYQLRKKKPHSYEFTKRPVCVGDRFAVDLGDRKLIQVETDELIRFATTLSNFIDNKINNGFIGYTFGTRVKVGALIKSFDAPRDRKFAEFILREVLGMP